MNIKNRFYEPLVVTLFRSADAIIGSMLFFVIFYQRNISREITFGSVILLFFITLVVFIYSGVYRSWRLSAIFQETGRIIFACFFVCAIFFFIGYFLKLTQYFPRRLMLLWVTLWPMVLFVERAIVRKALKTQRKNGRNTRKAVIIGSSKLGERLARWINNNQWSGTRILGFFNGTAKENIEGFPLLGHYDEMPEYVIKNNISIVYVALPVNQAAKIKWVLNALADSTVSVFMIPDVYLYEYINSSTVNYIDNIPVLSLIDTPIQGLSTVWKRLEDFTLSALIMILISPVILIVMLMIKLTSPGPVFFKQWRYGLDGKPIEIWKFRTMTVCEDGLNIKSACENDVRITKFGKFLRKFSIDELPQFINVLSGEMSIVGPRPHAISMVEEYRKQLKGAMLRHKIKPGITGLAQIYATRGEVNSFDILERRIEFDFQYIKQWSILLDLKIIFLTAIDMFNIKRIKREII